MRVLDLLGLTNHLTPEYVKVVPGQFDVVIDNPLARLHLLAQLREGAGVTIITGPTGAGFWSLVSVECTVRVEPDGYQYKERVDDPIQWAYLSMGARPSLAKTLAKTPPKTKRHKHWYANLTAHMLAARLASIQAMPLVLDPVPFTVEGVDDGIRSLRPTSTLRALDWEWHRQTQEPVGLCISTADSNAYVPVWGADVDERSRGPELQKAFEVYLKTGGRAILHGGAADLSTQIPGDPADLVRESVLVDDTMLMAYLLGYERVGLKPLTREVLKREPIENDYEWAEMPARFTGRYGAAGDTRNTYDLYMALLPKLIERGQYKVYREIEQPLIPVIASMNKYGSPVDIEAVKVLYRDHVLIEEGLRRAVLENYGRNMSVVDECYGFMMDHGQPHPGSLDQRFLSVNEHWTVDLILMYRQTRTRRRNFLGKILKGWVEAGKPEDYRVYPRFIQSGDYEDEDTASGPKTGRMACKAPNLMNQPRKIRNIYVPPKGMKFWSYDYSGLELRIAANGSGDPRMIQVLTELCPDPDVNGKCTHRPKHGDMHDQFRVYIEDTSGRTLARVPAKTGNFEQLYLGGVSQLGRILAKERIFLPRDVLELIVKSHGELYERYHEYAQELIDFGHRNGYTETWYGRRRYVPELFSADLGTVGHGERACVNQPTQGTAADIIKQAMVELQRSVLPYFGAHLAIQVHDELDGWIRDDSDLVVFDREVKKVMENYDIGPVKLFVDGGIGDNWDEVHDVG